jgi:putative transposase
VTYSWMVRHMGQFPVSAMCATLGACRSGFYAWRRSPEPKAGSLRSKLAKPIARVFADSGETYGSPRVTYALAAQGITACRNTVARCMKEHGIKVRKARTYTPRTTQSDPSLKPSPNILDRDFEATAMNQKWCSDITYVATEQGWLYVATIKDLYSKRIVGWAMADHMRAELTVSALKMAIKQRGAVQGLIHHSDRGKQYACVEYRALLEKHGVIQSMSQAGDCYDNAPAESFFASLKKELVNRCQFKTRQEAKQEVFKYIEVFYNRRRLHSALGYMSPEQFEAA